LLYELFVSEGIRIEPSASACLAGPGMFLNSKAGQHYLQRHNLLVSLHRATHVAWTTGGLNVPETEYLRFLARGEAMFNKVE